MTRFRVLSALAAGTIACAVCSSTAAATSEEPSTSSANWAGYVAGSDSGQEQFSRVSASWVQPTANCSSGQGSSAFWVGLGGADGQSQSLEQAGTEADCSSSGSASYFAWYELLPAAPVRLGVAVSPGDHISTAVIVSGSQVTISLTDSTSGNTTTKTLEMDDPDVSSAEWIAEAPSACDESGDCQPLTLTDFGSVTFTNASATANGHTGTISDPAWSAESTQLSGGAGASFAGFGGGQSSAGATPSSLSATGSSFSVSYQAAGSQSASTDPGQGAGGGYPGSSGDGAGGAGASGGLGGYGYDPGAGGSGSYGYGGGGYGGAGSGSYGYGPGGAGSGGYGYGDGAGSYGYGSGGDGYGYGAGSYGYGSDGYGAAGTSSYGYSSGGYGY